MNRTVRIRLRPTLEQAAALYETMRQFTVSFNAVCRVGWEQRRGNAYTLHRLTYRECRTALPELSSNLHVQAREKAAEAVRSALAREKSARKVSCPRSALCPPRYNGRTLRLDWEASTVSLSTTAGRLVLPFNRPRYAAYAIGLPVATADLICRKGRFYLHVVVALPPVEVPKTGPTIGVDLGVTRPAVTSDNRFHGQRHWREVVKRTFRLRRALQANGSKSAKRHLRRLAGREQRFRRDCDHVLSKSILQGLPPGTTIIVENLSHLRSRVKCRKGEGKRNSAPSSNTRRRRRAAASSGLIPATQASGATPAGTSNAPTGRTRANSAAESASIVRTRTSTRRRTAAISTLSGGLYACPAGRRQPAYRLGSASRGTEAALVQGQADAFRRQSLTLVFSFHRAGRE
jgi:transposase